MKIILFVEGSTERQSLPDFLKRWIDPQLSRPISVKAVWLGHGASRYVKELPATAQRLLNATDVAGGIGLLDLYRLENSLDFPAGVTTTEQRLNWAKTRLENTVGNQKFRQHFAIHEVETWLLSDLEIFPREVRKHISRFASSPEQCANPAEVLARAYRHGLRQPYQKVTDGAALFAELNAETACAKCPSLQRMLDDMVALAKAAGV